MKGSPSSLKPLSLLVWADLSIDLQIIIFNLAGQLGTHPINLNWTHTRWSMQFEVWTHSIWPFWPSWLSAKVHFYHNITNKICKLASHKQNGRSYTYLHNWKFEMIWNLFNFFKNKSNCLILLVGIFTYFYTFSVNINLFQPVIKMYKNLFTNPPAPTEFPGQLDLSTGEFGYQVRKLYCKYPFQCCKHNLL